MYFFFCIIEGKELIDVGNKLLATSNGIKESCCFSDHHLQRVIYWVYRYLIGRTFLDCSVMINVAIGIECDNVCTDCSKKKITNNHIVYTRDPL